MNQSSPLPEIQSSLIAKINDSHAQCMVGSDSIRAVILSMVNKARECGIYLTELKETTPHGQWERMFANRGGESETRFTFAYETARNYIRFASANPDQITELADGIRSVKDAMIASGALPAKTHGEQDNHATLGNFFIAAGKSLMGFSVLWEKEMKRHPIDKWQVETAEQFVAQMEPVVERINGILAAAKAMSHKD